MSNLAYPAPRPAYYSRARRAAYPTPADAFAAVLSYADSGNHAAESMRALRELLPECADGHETEIVRRHHDGAMINLADYFKRARAAAATLPHVTVTVDTRGVNVTLGG